MAEAADRLARSRAALERLERSLGRLERAMAARRGEQALAEELAKVRAAYDRLAATARGVEARLDGVRERLRAVVEA